MVLCEAGCLAAWLLIIGDGIEYEMFARVQIMAYPAEHNAYQSIPY
jgi:hypothetical protein